MLTSLVLAEQLMQVRYDKNQQPVN